MNKILLSPPKLGFIVVTRAALALGVGLLVSTRFTDNKRRVLGRTLAIAGILATIPALAFILQGQRKSSRFRM